MTIAHGYAAQSAGSMLAPFEFKRRDPGESDVQMEILFCGVCHSDLHQVRNEWNNSLYPMVPGHEIIGRITHVGSQVKKFKSGQIAGVGCLVDSCRQCANCQQGLEQFCDGQQVMTYNSFEKDNKTLTFGGYSTHIVVHEDFVLRIPDQLSPERAAPLLCAGITTYSPLKHVGVEAGMRVAIMGLGGLGHMAVKFASAMGAEVTVLSSSKQKESDAKALGAHEFIVTQDPQGLSKLQKRFDLILDAVSAPHDLNTYLSYLKRDGVMILVGVPPKSIEISAFSLIMRRRKVIGSLIGGLPETQEMLDYCAQKSIQSDVEVIPIQKINGAYERMLRGDVRYRFSIDMNSLPE